MKLPIKPKSMRKPCLNHKFKADISVNFIDLSPILYSSYRCCDVSYFFLFLDLHTKRYKRLVQCLQVQNLFFYKFILSIKVAPDLNTHILKTYADVNVCEYFPIKNLNNVLYEYTLSILNAWYEKY